MVSSKARHVKRANKTLLGGPVESPPVCGLNISIHPRLAPEGGEIAHAFSVLLAKTSEIFVLSALLSSTASISCSVGVMPVPAATRPISLLLLAS